MPNKTQLQQPPTLNIISLNINSLISQQKRASLLQLLNDHDPDVVLLGETKLNHRHTITYTNYTIHRSDRINATQGGGTAILIKHKIKHEKIQIPTLINSTIIETTIIKIALPSQEKLFIITAYAPGNNQKEFIPDLEKIITNLNLANQNTYYILAGDLNARHVDWKNTKNNPRGVQLRNWINSNAIKYNIHLRSTDLPSYPKGNSYIDLCLHDARIQFHDLINNNLRTIPFDSDHTALKFSISIENITHLETNSINKRPNFSAANWQKF